MGTGCGVSLTLVVAIKKDGTSWRGEVRDKGRDRRRSQRNRLVKNRRNFNVESSWTRNKRLFCLDSLYKINGFPKSTINEKDRRQNLAKDVRKGMFQRNVIRSDETIISKIFVRRMIR